MATIVNMNSSKASEKDPSYYNVIFANNVNVIIYLGGIIHVIMICVAIYFSFKCTPRFDPLHFTAALFLPPFYLIYVFAFKWKQCKFVSETSRNIQPDNRLGSFSDILKFDPPKTNPKPEPEPEPEPESEPEQLTKTRQDDSLLGNMPDLSMGMASPQLPVPVESDFKEKIDTGMDLFRAEGRNLGQMKMEDEKKDETKEKEQEQDEDGFISVKEEDLGPIAPLVGADSGPTIPSNANISNPSNQNDDSDDDLSTFNPRPIASKTNSVRTNNANANNKRNNKRNNASANNKRNNKRNNASANNKRNNASANNKRNNIRTNNARPIAP